MGTIPESKHKTNSLYYNPVRTRAMRNRSTGNGELPKPVLAVLVPASCRERKALLTRLKHHSFLGKALPSMGCVVASRRWKTHLRVGKCPFLWFPAPKPSFNNLVSYVFYLSGEAGLTWISGSFRICFFHFKWRNWPSDYNLASEIITMLWEGAPICWLRPSGWSNSCNPHYKLMHEHLAFLYFRLWELEWCRSCPRCLSGSTRAKTRS